MIPLSFILPSRNNLKYLKVAYESIRKHGGEFHEILIGDDGSSDGTKEWLEGLKDPHLKTFFHSPDLPRKGMTWWYDYLVLQSSNAYFTIWHADMILMPGSLEEVIKHLNEKTVVSMTRIEPHLWSFGHEKVLHDIGDFIEQYDENKCIDFVEKCRAAFKGKTTGGIFAPWTCSRQTYLNAGGHDHLFAPSSREDTDLFYRFQKLHNIRFTQSWQAFAIHYCCRGSRFNETITKVGIDSDEWKKQNARSEKRFHKKWGQEIQLTQFLEPIINKNYLKIFIVKNANPDIVKVLFPLCHHLYYDCPPVSDEDFKDFVGDSIGKEIQHYDDFNRNFDGGVHVFIDGSLIDVPQIQMLKNLNGTIAGAYQVQEAQLSSAVKIHIKSFEEAPFTEIWYNPLIKSPNSP